LITPQRKDGIVENNHTLARLDSLLKLYNRQALVSKYCYLFLKISQVFLAASIPIVALVSPARSSPLVNALLGASILVMQGVQQALQPNKRWVQNRVAARTLASEKHLYLANAGPYRDLKDADAMVAFAERVESFADMQNERWKDLIESTFQADGHRDRIIVPSKRARPNKVP
jgi:hypothetical protein